MKDKGPQELKKKKTKTQTKARPTDDAHDIDDDEDLKPLMVPITIVS